MPNVSASLHKAAIYLSAREEKGNISKYVVSYSAQQDAMQYLRMMGSSSHCESMHYSSMSRTLGVYHLGPVLCDRSLGHWVRCKVQGVAVRGNPTATSRLSEGGGSRKI